MESITSPDMGMVGIKPGTILLFKGCVPDEAENRKGWYWYNFEVLLTP
jgi:hypothetical protein